MPLLPLDQLAALRADWGARGLRVAVTNGVFDLLHIGHVAYLEQARSLADVLVVALNSDASTRTLKGPARPLTPEAERAALLSALRCVDYVTIFSEPTAERVVSTLRPDVYVKGGDYAAGAGSTPDLARLPEARVVQSYGGEVCLLPYTHGRSTSELIRLIVERYGPQG